MLYGYYIITIYNGSTLVTTLLCDLERKVWFEFKNITAKMYAERTSGPGTASADGHEELFVASRAAPRVLMMSSCWNPALANASDADGAAVLPGVETPFYKLGSPGLKRIRRAYVSYDVRAAGNAPYLQVSQITSPEDTAYVNASPTLTTTTKVRKGQVEIRRKAIGVALNIEQVGASADTRLYDIELEAHDLEASR